MSALWQQLRGIEGPQRVFAGLLAVLVLGGAFFLLDKGPEPLLLAGAALGVLVVLVDWRILYYLLFFLLPFSLEISLPGGLSMDVPSEPLLLALTACVVAALLLGTVRLRAAELRHPILLVLVLMLLWSLVDVAFSVDALKSVKYLLAKVWYLTPFVLGTLVLIRQPAAVWRLLAVYAAGACLSVLYTAARHATTGFSFEQINWAIYPFFHNHVIYATMLALLVPFAWYGQRRASRPGARWAWRVALGILLFGLLTSYTRASILSLPVAAGFYLVVRLRLTRVVLLLAALGTAGATAYLLEDNRFMLYAPDFEKTIFNGQNFGAHLEATYKFQDVSGMERVYRWVAATRMIAARPWTGSGPSTFYPEYKKFTVRSFKTYVSRNPEKSTSHNYFLLQLAEQGIPGFVLFLALVTVTLLTAERLYHQARRPEHRQVVLAVTLALAIIIFHLLLNELVENDKVGSVFFVGLALLVRADSWVREEQASLSGEGEEEQPTSERG